MHLSDELLSSYLDGELSPAQAHRASEHLRDCPRCAQALGTFAALDHELAAPPALSCAQAAPFLSAKLDAELGAEEAEIATVHLATCTRCRADVARWSAAEVALKAMSPARPSTRVDAFVAALGRQPERRVAATGLVRAWPVPALALATAVTLVLVLAIPPAGQPAAQNDGDVVVASLVQQVLNPNTNTLYQLRVDQGVVVAIDSQTGAQKGVIKVGGKPMALALNLASNTVVVLDASHKTVTEIDGSLTAVTASTTVDVPGTPTSVQVDTKGNVVVAAVATQGRSEPAAGGAPTGFIATIDGGTKQVDSVREVEIAPSVIVIEPNGKRALLISAKSTILADAVTFAPLATLPGGIGAAFSVGRDDFAVLANGTSGASVRFARGGSIPVGGIGRAITSLPGGGFAILAELGGANVITVINADGVIATSISVPGRGTDFTYDPLARKFTVVGGSGLVATAPLPETATQAPPQVVVGTPLPTAQATPQPTPAASPKPLPTPVPTEPVVVVAAPEKDTLVPTKARAVWPGTYLVSVESGQRPSRSISDGGRIWYLDDSNRVNVLHMLSGELFQVATLPRSTTVSAIAVSPNHVYFVDGATSSLFIFTINTEQMTQIPFAFAPEVIAAAGSPDERLWLATRNSGLVGYDPRSGRVETVPVGTSLAVVATDRLGRVWFAAADRQAIDVYDPLAKKVVDLSLTHAGAITAMAVDRTGTAWVGTDRGEAFAIKGLGVGDVVVTHRLIGEPVTSFVLDQAGGVYFVDAGGASVAFGRPLSGGGTRIAPAGASEPMFDSLGRAWQADKGASGFYVTLPGALP
jgi:anti-sigma factor RsiW/streptogramin lyase